MNSLGRGLSRFATRCLRRHLVGPDQHWTFEPPAPDWSPPPVERTSLYLHVPFCRNSCPYCPYTKVPYDQALIEPYTRAAIAEVDRWADAIGHAEITSVYVGGGTPTHALASVARVLERVRERFHLTGDICIETSPPDINHETVRRLHDLGARLISLGVQSFRAEHLATLGRCYQSAAAERALALLAASGFESVNADLMFALPGQTAEHVASDLARASELGASQLTVYPLFTFPYTTVGEYLRLKAVRMPDLHARRRQYQAICDWCSSNGFERVSVWGFKRGAAPRYSSVTRDGYIGIGPGAGSHLHDGFTVNTFDLAAWVQSLDSGRSPIALRMPFTGHTGGWWWLYWRFYDTRIPLDAVGPALGGDARKALRWMGAVKCAGLARRNGLDLELTDRGAFWLHLVQNHFALAYVNTLWTAARQHAWPPAVAM